MKILMVGSGAVGQVFGLYLQKAGVELAFYVRSGSAAKLEQALSHDGLPLFQISHSRKQNPISHRLDHYQVVTDIVSSRRFDPDQIWFTTPSTVYYSAWYREFVTQVPSEQVVLFAPEAGRPEFIPEGAPEGVNEDRFVFGGITFIAWQGDLAGGGGRPDAVNFWGPPLLEIPLMGAENACFKAAQPMKKAGLRVGLKKRDFYKSQAALTAVMTALVSGLELSGWSLRAFRRGPWLKNAARGAREAALSQLPRNGFFTKALLGLLLSPVGVFFISLLLPLLTPFNLEQYLKFHYRKTRDQSLALLDLFIRDGEHRGLPVEDVRSLLTALNDLSN
jgi:2-dehydropantoate 2-reductase